jgi:hypothetical protein
VLLALFSSDSYSSAQRQQRQQQAGTSPSTPIRRGVRAAVSGALDVQGAYGEGIAAAPGASTRTEDQGDEGQSGGGLSGAAAGGGQGQGGVESRRPYRFLSVFKWVFAACRGTPWRAGSHCASSPWLCTPGRQNPIVLIACSNVLFHYLWCRWEARKGWDILLRAYAAEFAGVHDVELHIVTKQAFDKVSGASAKAQSFLTVFC